MVSATTSATIWPAKWISGDESGGLPNDIGPPPATLFTSPTRWLAFSWVRTSSTPGMARTRSLSMDTMRPRAMVLVARKACAGPGTS
jgi:hypothetical protein